MAANTGIRWGPRTWAHFLDRPLSVGPKLLQGSGFYMNGNSSSINVLIITDEMPIFVPSLDADGTPDECPDVFKLPDQLGTLQRVSTDLRQDPHRNQTLAIIYTSEIAALALLLAIVFFLRRLLRHNQ